MKLSSKSYIPICIIFEYQSSRDIVANNPRGNMLILYKSLKKTGHVRMFAHIPLTLAMHSCGHASTQEHQVISFYV